MKILSIMSVFAQDFLSHPSYRRTYQMKFSKNEEFGYKMSIILKNRFIKEWCFILISSDCSFLKQYFCVEVKLFSGRSYGGLSYGRPVAPG